MEHFIYEDEDFVCNNEGQLPHNVVVLVDTPSMIEYEYEYGRLYYRFVKIRKPEKVYLKCKTCDVVEDVTEYVNIVEEDGDLILLRK